LVQTQQVTLATTCPFFEYLPGNDPSGRPFQNVVIAFLLIDMADPQPDNEKFITEINRFCEDCLIVIMFNKSDLQKDADAKAKAKEFMGKFLQDKSLPRFISSCSDPSINKNKVAFNLAVLLHRNKAKNPIWQDLLQEAEQLSK